MGFTIPVVADVACDNCPNHEGIVLYLSPAGNAGLVAVPTDESSLPRGWSFHNDPWHRRKVLCPTCADLVVGSKHSAPQESGESAAS